MNLLDLMVKVGVDDQATNKIGALSGDIKGKLSTAAKAGAVALAAVTAAAAGATRALVEDVKEVAAYGDNVDKMSQKLGVSSEAYQKWDYVMNIAGTSMDNMSMGMKTLTNKLDDAKNGSSDAQAMFAKLGLSMEDLNSMSREEAFEATIKGFQGMADSTERAALANDLFGRSGQELTPLFNMTTEQTNELMEATDRLGIVMSEDAVKAAAAYTDSYTTLTKTMDGLKHHVVSEFLPGITTMMDGLTELISGDADKGAELIEQGVEQIIEVIERIGPRIVDIIARIAEVVAPPLVEALGLLVATMAAEIVKHIPDIMQIGLELIGSLLTGIVQGIEPIMTQINEMGQGILDSIGSFFMGMFNAGKELIQNIKDGAAQTASDMAAFFGGFIQAGLDAVLKFLGDMLGAGVKLWTNLKDGASRIGSSISDTFGGWISSALSSILSFYGGMWSAGIGLVSNLIDGASDMGWDIGSIFSSWLDAAYQTVANFASWFYNAGVQIINGLVSGIADNFWAVIDTITGGLSSAVNSAMSFLGIASPSKLFAWMGDMTMEGMAEGIEDTASKAERAMRNAAEGIYGAASGEVALGVSTSSAQSGLLAEIRALREDVRNVKLAVNMDGRTTASILYPYIDERMYQEAVRAGAL